MCQIFWENIFCRPKLGKWAKNIFFLILRTIWSLIFPEFALWWKFMLFFVFLHKSHIWEKCCFWDIGENALSCWDYQIFKSSISPEERDETASLFACWCKFTKIKSCWKDFWLEKNENMSQKWVWPIWSVGSKIDCTSRKNWWY